MLALILVMSIWIPALIGLGTLFPGLPGETRHPAEAGLLGLVVVSFTGILVNFFLPVTGAVSILICLAGYGLLGFHRARLAELSSPFVLGPIAVFVIATAYCAVSESLLFDTGLYHLPSLLWIRDSALPFGLANVTSLLAYNSAWFPAAAALSLPGLGKAAAFCGNSLALTFFFSFLVSRLAAAAPAPRAVPLSLIFVAGCLFLANDVGGHVGQLSPNIPARLFSLYAWLLVAQALEAEGRSVPLTAVLAAGFATACKLFALPAFACCLALYVFRRGRESRALYAWTLVFAGLWIARGLMLSGCVLYPLAASCMTSLPWAMKLEEVTSIAAHIDTMNNLIYTSLRAGDWDTTFRQLRVLATYGFVKRIGIALVAAIAAALIARRRGGDTRVPPLPRHAMLLAVAFHLTGFTFWFVHASTTLPFGFHHILGLAFLVIALVGRRALPESLPRGAAAGLAIVVAVFVSLRSAYLTQSSTFSWTKWPVYRAAEYDRREVAGIAVNVPKPEWRCWDTPIPCVYEATEGKFVKFRGFGGRDEYRDVRDLQQLRRLFPSS